MNIHKLEIVDENTLVFSTNRYAMQFFPYALPKRNGISDLYIIIYCLITIIFSIFIFLLITIKLGNIFLSTFSFLAIISLSAFHLHYQFKRKMLMKIQFFKKTSNTLIYFCNDTPFCSLKNVTHLRVIIRLFYVVSYKNTRLIYTLYQTLCLEAVSISSSGQVEFLRLLEDSSHKTHSLRKNFNQIIEKIQPVIDWFNLPCYIEKDYIYWENTEHYKDWKNYSADWILASEFETFKPKI